MLKIILKSENILLAIIMLVAIFLRFFLFDGWSLSNDELSALAMLQHQNLSESIKEGVLMDFHPAGVHVFQWYWTGLFGTNVWAVRLPFVIFGIISVYVVYLLGEQWFNKNVALLSAASFAILQYPILFSQLARPYSPGLLFTLLCVLFWTRIIFKKETSLINYSGFALFAALSAYTHNYSFLFVFIIGATGLFFITKKELFKYLLSVLVAALLYLPHIQIFLYQFNIGGVGGQDGWLAPPDPFWIFAYLKYAFNDSWIFMLFIFAIGILGFFINAKKRFSRFQWIAIAWFLISFLIGYFYSILRNPILQHSILLFAFPFLILFLFSFYQPKNSKITNMLVLAILLFGLIHISFIGKFYKQQHFGEFKGLAENISAWNTEFGKENITNVIVANHPFYIHYYLDSMASGISFAQYDNLGGEDFLALKNIVNESSSPYFSYAWTKPALLEIEDIIKSKYPCKIRWVDYEGLSAVSLYTMEKSDTCISPDSLIAEYLYDFENNSYVFGLSTLSDTSDGRYGNTIAKYDGITYGLGFIKKAEEINNSHFKRVKASLRVFADFSPRDIELVLSFENKEGNIYFYYSADFKYFITESEWCQVFLDCYVPQINAPDDIVRIFIWNKMNQTFNIDDFHLTFY